MYMNETITRTLAKELAKSVKEYFADETHQREFEEWLKQRNNSKTQGETNEH